MRFARASLLLALTVSATPAWSERVGEAERASPEFTGCAGATAWQKEMAPVDSGPVVLSAVSCLEWQPGQPAGPLHVSPDGRWAFASDSQSGVWIWSLNGKRTAAQQLRNAAANMSFGGVDQTVVAWREDSRGVWAAAQPIIYPLGGGALAPLKTLTMGIDGRKTQLPQPRSRSGWLDQLAWIGNGFALVTFDNRGRYRRPEVADADPRVALLDARRGRILATMSLPAPVGFPQFSNSVSAVAGTINAKGLPHVMMKIAPNRWYDWEAGHPPRELVQFDGKPWMKFALTRDGQKLLIATGLSAQGIICEHNAKCPAPTPQSGPAVALLDLSTGRSVWTMERTATGFSSALTPAISPDGRRALVMLPAEDGKRQTVALIAMADGRILQRLGMSGSAQSYGFLADGSAVWISAGSTVATYRFR